MPDQTPAVLSVESYAQGYAAAVAARAAVRDRLMGILDAVQAIAADLRTPRWPGESFDVIADQLDRALNGGTAPVPSSSRRAQEPERPTAGEVARLFHETYEELAPLYGYRTREASAKPWAEVPQQNRELMIATCARVLQVLDGSSRRAQETDRCGPDCSEGHTYMAGCAIKPPARAFLGERPCGRRGCPCGGAQ